MLNKEKQPERCRSCRHRRRMRHLWSGNAHKQWCSAKWQETFVNRIECDAYWKK